MSDGDIFLGLVTLSVAKLGYLALCRNAKLQKYEKVGTVKSINLFPVKCAGALDLQSAICMVDGLNCNGIKDRHWMFVKENGKFFNARLEPKLVLIKPTVEGDTLRLDAPGMPSLVLPRTINMDSQSKITKYDIFGDYIAGLRCGEEAAKWIQQYTGEEGAYMVVTTDDMDKRQLCEVPKAWGNTYKRGDVVAFSDTGPYMILSEASVKDLNTKIEKQVTTLRFRPNITVEGCPAYDEDRWAEVRIGDDVYFRVNESCPRCSFVNVDPETGVKNTAQNQPFKTLSSYRKFLLYDTPCFGVIASLDLGGEIKVGDPVYAIRK